MMAELADFQRNHSIAFFFDVGNRHRIRIAHAAANDGIHVFTVREFRNHFTNSKFAFLFGIVFAEANICGKPVIAGASGGTGDIVKDGVNGYLVNPEDPGEISEKIKLLIDDKALASRLGRQGKEMVMADFDC